MAGPQKHQLAATLLLAVVFWAGQGLADADDPRLDPLFERLGDPQNPDWERAEAEIIRIWERSGSPAMDHLLSRGQDALEARDLPAAVGHLSALVDHAPGFAEGWNARATAFFMMGEYTLALADVEQALALNPRHFGALSGLAIMLEELGDEEGALTALRAARDLNPHWETVNQAIGRLERSLGGAEL